MMSDSLQLPSHIKHDSADAFNISFALLYCRQSKDVREMIDRVKDNFLFSTRETDEFFKEVIRMAQYQPSLEDLKARERKEKMNGEHISQIKKKMNNNQDSNFPASGENPS